MKQKLDLSQYADLEAAELTVLNNLKKFSHDEIFQTLLRFIKTEPNISLRTALALAAVLLEEK